MIYLRIMKFKLGLKDIVVKAIGDKPSPFN